MPHVRIDQIVLQHSFQMFIMTSSCQWP